MILRYTCTHTLYWDINIYKYILGVLFIGTYDNYYTLHTIKKKKKTIIHFLYYIIFCFLIDLSFKNSPLSTPLYL